MVTLSLSLNTKFSLYNSAYFDRYRNTKIFQIQAADDQFFLLDNEVPIEKKTFKIKINAHVCI